MTTVSPPPPVLASAAAMQAAASAEPAPPSGASAASAGADSGSTFSAVLTALDAGGAPAEGITGAVSSAPVPETAAALFAVADGVRPGVELSEHPVLQDSASGELLPPDGQALPVGDTGALPDMSIGQAVDPVLVPPLGLTDASAARLPSPLAASPLTETGSTTAESMAEGTSPALPAAGVAAAGQAPPAAPSPAAWQQTAATAHEANAAEGGSGLATPADLPASDPIATDPPPSLEPQSRLHTMMAALDRAAPGLDPSSVPLSGAPAGNAGAPALNATPATTASPGFTDLPALQPAADPQTWTQGLGERLLVMAEKGQQSATLRLQPEQLGPLQIHIRVEEDGASQVLFSAHHQQTREAIEQALPRLRELFAEQGLHLAQANIDSGQGTFSGRDWPTPWAGERAEAGTATETTDSPGAIVWQLRPPSPRRIDVLI